jgi:hypothetical protein
MAEALKEEVDTVVWDEQQDVSSLAILDEIGESAAL